MAGSSTEEEFENSFSTTPSVSTNRKSNIFWLIRYPLLIIVTLLTLCNLLLYTLTRTYVLVVEFVQNLFSKARRQLLKLSESKDYQTWLKNAHEIDEILGYDQWKTQINDESQFDEALLTRLSRRLKRDLVRHDLPKLMNTLVNSACKQDIAGVECEQLYSRCYSGTKLSIDAYYNQVVEALGYVAESDALSVEEKARFFKQVSVTYGRTALCLSGGATFGYFHLGVMKALFEQGYLPNIITGTSAGAMMAAMVCVRTDDELEEIFSPELANRTNCLKNSWYEMLTSLYKTGALLTDEFFREEAIWFTKKDMTFLEAYELTGRVLNISVMSDEAHSKTKNLNYINSPQITVRSAVVASSAIPGLLPACPLYFKDSQGRVQRYFGNGRLWRDGSLRADIPEKELQQIFRVRYTIVSQVNPHVSAFFFRPRGHPGNPSGKRGWRGGFISSTFVKLFLLEIHKWLAFVRDMELLPRLGGANFSNIFSQTFEGNLTILPKIRWVNFRNVMTDPNVERMELFLRDGQMETYPVIKPLSNRMKIEHTIGLYLAQFKNMQVIGRDKDVGR